MARPQALLALLLFASLTSFLLVVAGCPAPEPADPEKICTAGAYVFCRCEDKAEGTKLCGERGNAFGKCVCGVEGNRTQDPSRNDAGKERVGTFTDDAGVPISENCVGKLAVLASSEEKNEADPAFENNVFGAAYSKVGTWTVDREQTNPLRGPPRGGVVNGDLVVIWHGKFDRILWTRFKARQDKLDEATMVRTETFDPFDTFVTPAFVSSAASGRIFFLHEDNSIREGAYSSTAGWDDASALVTPGNPPVAGKSAPAAALVGSNYVLAFAGADHKVYTQTQTSGAWGAPVALPDAVAFDGAAPAMVSLVGGTEELLLVYQGGGDQLLHYTTRTGGGWSVPALVDTTATGDGKVSVATLSKGRAMLVWTGLGGEPKASLYNPAGDPKWSSPATILPNTGRVRTPPTISSGRCGGEATVTYVDETGDVNLALFGGDKWNGPYPIPGLRNMTWAGAGEVP